MGQSQGGALEIIGDDRNDIDAATLLVGFPSDNNSVIIENTALLLRFIKNADPSWSGGARWMNGAIERLSAGEESVDVIRGERRISMQMVKEFGLVIVTVKHRLAD